MTDSPSPQCEKDKIEFSIGQVVWAKLDGFPWWPARIANISEAPPSVKESLVPKPDHALVYFFGDHNFAFLRENKIQPFTEKYSERVLNVKIKNFKAALQESQLWVNSKGTYPAIGEFPPHVEHSPEHQSVSSPYATQLDGTITPPPPLPLPPPHVPPISSPINNFPTKKRSPSPPFIHAEYSHEPFGKSVLDISLSSELAKIWEHEEVDEDKIDDYIIISSEKDMRPVVAFYDEQKRKIALQTAQTLPKRPKTDSPTFTFKPQPPMQTTLPPTSFTPIPYQPPIRTPPTPVHLTSPSHAAPLKNTSSSTHAAMAHASAIRRHTIKGAATNGFTVVPLRGVVEGNEEGLHVEFTVQGNTYRGFLIARDAFPAMVSPLVPPIPPSHPSYPPTYANVAKMTGLSVAKQHHERLVDLGRLVVASAMVPYAYPPPLHL